MSGGSYNYAYSTVRDEYVGRMHDKELDSMMHDLIKVLRDVEWWQSSDTGETEYRKTVKEFKDKWFNGRNDTCKQAILEILNDAKKEIESL